nr:hypothetical protein [uncultured Oscillibacter sp.]
MCEICHYTPCLSGCPNAPDPPAAFECHSCGEGICPGDEYARIGGAEYCERCIDDMEGPDTDDSVKVLDRDLADEVFCGEIQDMVILCYEVIKLNFRGFFKKLGARSGSLAERLRRTVTPTSVNGESST